ncbi:1-acyl-sn-glycerol-3-phosphate acyltransferase [Flavobacterium columnare]|uniref:1-acyl-sn-glycerol-3-phosphate acyltransferase n=3 Tax=Flavobacteriaceae TaxID=49546 RepID=A0A2N9PA62_9FLAO|nr:lysophospholipid acyltransferase family protein [Flavobacterium columnare]RVU91176.1 1-acyl-sn-glycerol-3-phosphate acyltransferase [Flavobacterium columnare]SPE77262.1 1-acyl-sn-glycerol-3-phosphate acyltransferase [Flavobacterium columnare]
MQMLKILFWSIWRLWFYVLVLIPILIMSPFLTLSLSRDSWYPYFFKMARLWAKTVLYGMGFYYKIKEDEEVLSGHSYMFIANHTSMTDIMLMLAVVKNPFVFVGKKELVKIPIFGFFYKRAAIMVDRESMRSRSEVYERAKARIEQGLSICIFPEGKVPDDESVVLDEFKSGAFNIAIDHQLTIVPMVFYDNKNLFSYTFFSGKPGCLRVKFLSFVRTKGMGHDDKKTIKEKARGLIMKELMSDSIYMKCSN